MPKKMFAARIDEGLYDAISTYCSESNISQAQFIERLGRKFLGEVVPLPSSIDDRVELLEGELAEIRSRIDKMSAPVIRPRCPDCNWHQPRKNGARSDGSQQWICNRCGRSWHQELVLHTINQN